MYGLIVGWGDCGFGVGMQCYLITRFVVCERVWFGYCFASCGFCGFVKVGCLRVGLWGWDWILVALDLVAVFILRIGLLP